MADWWFEQEPQDFWHYAEVWFWFWGRSSRRRTFCSDMTRNLVRNLQRHHQVALDYMTSVVGNASRVESSMDSSATLLAVWWAYVIGTRWQLDAHHFIYGCATWMGDDNAYVWLPMLVDDFFLAGNHIVLAAAFSCDIDYLQGNHRQHPWNWEKIAAV